MMLTVHINIGLNEYLDFTRVSMKMNKPFKRAVRIIRFLFPFLLLMISLSDMFSPDPKDWILPGIYIVLGLLWIYYCPAYFTWKALRKAKKIYADPSNRYMFGEREISFSEDTVEIKAPGDYTKMEWSKFICFKETDKGFYLFPTLFQGYIISKDQISLEEQSEIRELLSTKIKSPIV